ncbi:hypothetical protein NPIL_215461 [Nephila pilipes]|uniref:Uncharacterized protein n=1 Tax=Nephila pilipes TaxID=299642 RepID=A0A8X6P784_NEPPI|nr:hypothetical protein NPIL_215461 [Nephila pilipes]
MSRVRIAIATSVIVGWRLKARARCFTSPSTHISPLSNVGDASPAYNPSGTEQKDERFGASSPVALQFFDTIHVFPSSPSSIVLPVYLPERSHRQALANKLPDQSFDVIFSLLKSI